MSIKTTKAKAKESKGVFSKVLFIQHHTYSDDTQGFECHSEVNSFESEGLIAVYELKEVKRLELRSTLVEVDK